MMTIKSLHQVLGQIAIPASRLMVELGNSIHFLGQLAQSTKFLRSCAERQQEIKRIQEKTYSACLETNSSTKKILEDMREANATNESRHKELMERIEILMERLEDYNDVCDDLEMTKERVRLLEERLANSHTFAQ